MVRAAVKAHKRRLKFQAGGEQQLHEFLAQQATDLGMACSDLIEGTLIKWAKRRGYKPKD